MQRPLTTTGALYRSKPSRIKLGASLLKLFMVSIEVESDDRHGELPPGDGGRASGSFMAAKDGSGEGLQQCLMWMVQMLALAYVNTSLSEEVPLGSALTATVKRKSPLRSSRRSDRSQDPMGDERDGREGTRSGDGPPSEGRDPSAGWGSARNRGLTACRNQRLGYQAC